MKKYFLGFLLAGCVVPVCAQNNAIFGGGVDDGFNRTAFSQAMTNIYIGASGDGFDRTSFLQAGTNIFNGGQGDGFDKAAFAQAAFNIFNGGNGDGWEKTAFSQPETNIFFGGAGDGWDRTDFSQPVTNIYNGGEGDGWDSNNFSQPGNNIFPGGIGDGWASTYRPLGPLPLNLLTFTAVKYKSASLLEWKTAQEYNCSHFDVERSADAMFFTKIGQVTAAGNSVAETVYQFTDHSPLRGMNYYRLKQTDINGQSVYTPARLVRFDETNPGTVRYFPNPTRGVLTIELNGINSNDMRLVTVSNAAGIVVSQLKIGATAGSAMQIDLSRFPKGVYFIQVHTTMLNSTERIVLQ